MKTEVGDVEDHEMEEGKGADEEQMVSVPVDATEETVTNTAEEDPTIPVLPSDAAIGEELVAGATPITSNNVTQQALLPFQKTSTNAFNDEELKSKYAPGSAPYWIGPAAINAHERARR